MTTSPPAADFQCTISSFGFKYGDPTSADWVVDVRPLPNPFWVDDLRPFDGLNSEVRDYILNAPETKELISHLLPMMDIAIAHYRRNQRNRLHIAIGCTGGRHRSVTVSILLADRLRAEGIVVEVAHRDIDREGNA